MTAPAIRMAAHELRRIGAAVRKPPPLRRRPAGEVRSRCLAARRPKDVWAPHRTLARVIAEMIEAAP
jgi:hypothetical protein